MYDWSIYIFYIFKLYSKGIQMTIKEMHLILCYSFLVIYEYIVEAFLSSNST